MMAKEEAATTTAEKAKPGPKPGKKASELEALRAEVAKLRGEPAAAQAKVESKPAKIEPAKAVFDAAALKAALAVKVIPIDIPGIGSYNMRADRWVAREAEQAKWYNDDGVPDFEKWAVSKQAARIKACQLTGLDWTKFVK